MSDASGAGDGRPDVSGIVRAFPQPFGRYMLLHPLAQGGMGAVFLAKYAGAAAAFERMCVIKTVRRALTEEPEALPRFFDELKIVAQLNHKNICGIFDAGAVDGRCYFAMEHVAGVDLLALSERCTRSGAPIPPAVAVHVIGEVLEALAYSHRLVDGVTGRPLGIVHRDVSPHNVLVSFEGEVKLIDFGLVLSRLKTNKTEPHVVVGKVSYMSPEHASGDPVDARSDQYSIAVVATELFTGAGFYADVTSQQTMWAKAAMGGHRPSGFAKLEPQLRAVLDRALQPAPEDRFASCEDFRDALDAWAIKSQAFATPHTLRSLVHKHFAAEAEERRLLLASFADVPAVLPSPSSSSAPSSTSTAASSSAAARISAGLTHAPPMVATSRMPTPQPATITAQMLAAAMTGHPAVAAPPPVFAPPLPPLPPLPPSPSSSSSSSSSSSPSSSPLSVAGPVAAPLVAPTTLVEAPPLAAGGEMPKRDTQPMERPRLGSGTTTDEAPPPVVVDAAAVSRLHAENAPRIQTSPGAPAPRPAHQRATAPPDLEAAMRALPKPSAGATEVVARASPSPFAKTHTGDAADETAPYFPVALPPEATAELPARRARGAVAGAIVAVVILLVAVAALAWAGLIPGVKLR